MPKGFTLIEILVAISIVALIGVVAIPNLKGFNALQIVKNSSSELKNTLKNAQSRANSNIKCSAGPSPSSSAKSAISWTVTIRNVVPPAYDLKGICEDGFSVTHLSTAFPPEITIPQISCPVYPAVLTFTKNNFTYTCGPAFDPSPTPDFSITIQNSSDSTQKSIIKVSKGGIVSEQ